MEKMVPFKTLISREEAFKIIMENAQPIQRTEIVSIDDAPKRILAEKIRADKDVPPFDRSAMDGYALKAEDTFGASELSPKPLKLVGVLHAGESASRVIEKGECIQIATGCPIPPGANAVLMVEFTEQKEDIVYTLKTLYPGANISPRGEDMKKGDLILNEGELLTPAKIGVLAAQSRKTVSVYQKPRIVVIPTGTEIREIGSDLKEGQIYDVNSHTLTALVRSNGASVTRSPIVPDQMKELSNTIDKFSDHDLVVFSGGSSVGERDLLARIVDSRGQVLFHGVQIKPGKPTLFGLVRKKPIFGLPGYPTSCLSNAYIFLIPFVRKMGRLPTWKPMTCKATMARRIVSSSGREQFLPVKLVDGKALPVFKKSGDITSLANADGYIVLPVNLDVIEEG